MTAAIDYGTCGRDRDLLRERNDCAVIALAVASQISYADCHRYLAQNGRRLRSASGRTVELYQNVLDMVQVPREEWAGRTVRTFAANCDAGTYIVMTSGHVLCVRHGVAEDWTSGRLHRITRVWRVVE
jgi:hypothetical protein